ncbi:DUF4185 domain-containing protein [Francisella sp. Scap27]|uniref:DUF4185 domain-containing protein n=1 Tax=Francisella sp. Scap27 TaxID=2589986 RepID=UPI0015B96672|nr:DUF4185 domain-containing protein [Francisella sp. Scap27]
MNKLACSTIFLLTITSSYSYTLKCESKEFTQTNQYQKIFHNKGTSLTQWLGGDNDNSIKIADNKYIWTFGDTLLGKYIQNKDYKYFIHDSIGIMDTSDSNDIKMSFNFKKDEFGNPTEFFKPEGTTKDEYFWILSGAKSDYKLMLGLATIINTDTSFEILDTVYAVIDNPNDAPNDWNYKLYNIDKLLDFSEEFSELKWNVSIVNGADDYVYIFGIDSKNSLLSNLYVARISTESIRNADFKKIEFLTKGKNSWQNYSDKTPLLKSNLKSIEGLPATNEASFYYNENHNKWYTVYISPFSYDVKLLSSDSLLGEWQDNGVIYKVPAPWSTIKQKGKNLFMSYAPKIHPDIKELNESDNTNNLSFVFEYVNNVNGFELPNIWNEQGHQIVQNYSNFYIPLFVNVNCQILD